MGHHLSWKNSRIPQSLKQLPHFTKPKGSSLYLRRLRVTPIVSQINPVLYLSGYSFDIHFHITLPFVLNSSKWSPCFRFLHQEPVRVFLLPRICHVPPAPPPHLFDLINPIIWHIYTAHTLGGLIVLLLYGWMASFMVHVGLFMLCADGWIDI